VYPVIMPEPTYYDIKDLADSTGLRAEWSGKQDALTADVDYLTPSTAGTTYEPKKSTGENYVSDEELEVLQNTSGEN
uniref:hypothetical protein n=1 Tax=Escherichia coli TaxID=562 RepID=UPI003F81443D